MEAVALHRDLAGLAANTFSPRYWQAGVSLVSFSGPRELGSPKPAAKGGGGCAAAAVKWVLITKHRISSTREAFTTEGSV